MWLITTTISLPEKIQTDVEQINNYACFQFDVVKGKLHSKSG
jgi:hypothetical protein